MKKTLRRILIASTVMMTALTAGVFTSCVRGSLEDQKRKEGYVYTVTYDANGGSFGSNTSRTYALVKKDYPTLAPGYVDAKSQISIKIPERMDYELVGEAVDNGNENTNEEAILSKSWFLAQTDENGNIRYDSEGEPITATTPWNFATDKVTGDITLVAKWSQLLRFSIFVADVDANNNPIETQIGSTKAKFGDTIYDKLYKKESDGTIDPRPDKIIVRQSGYTLLDFYLDKTYETPLTPEFTHPGKQVIGTETDPETGETTEITTNIVKIYARYIKGDYEFISKENKRALTNSSKWYLLEDVDFTGSSDWKAVTSFKGHIIGNGFTISNVTVKSTAKNETSNADKIHSIFGKMSGTVENLTLANVTMRVETTAVQALTSKQIVAFLAAEMTEGSAMTNVTLKDCKILLKNSGENDVKLFTKETAEEKALWGTAVAPTQATVIIKENDQDATAIKIVEE